MTPALVNLIGGDLRLTKMISYRWRLLSAMKTSRIASWMAKCIYRKPIGVGQRFLTTNIACLASVRVTFVPVANAGDHPRLARRSTGSRRVRRHKTLRR